MEVRSKYESPLVLEKIEIVESSFRKKTDSLDSLELGVQVERNLTKLDDGCFGSFTGNNGFCEEEKVFVNVKGRAVFRPDRKIWIY